MTLTLRNTTLLALIAVLVLALVLISALVLDQTLHLGLLHFLLHLPAWGTPCC